MTRSLAAKRRTKRTTKLWVQEKSTAIRDDYGTPTAGWTATTNPDGTPVWLMGHVDKRSGREIEIARMTAPTVNSRISIPPVPGLSVQHHRLVNARNGEVYELGFINNVDDLEREYIVLATSVPRSGKNTTSYDPAVTSVDYDASCEGGGC